MALLTVLTRSRMGDSLDVGSHGGRWFDIPKRGNGYKDILQSQTAGIASIGDSFCCRGLDSSLWQLAANFSNKREFI